MARLKGKVKHRTVRSGSDCTQGRGDDQNESTHPRRERATTVVN